ncbi:hypothetical protein ACFQGT_16200 [Natrialbaceae archaeon GCM10025810]|uniref:DUF7139 domain-containing protein n=1 Tax=Halovalidus salilacus TaxID=3075124 RepID=UPI00360D1D3D
MTSLTEVYRGKKREVSNPKRLYAGMALVFLGALLVVVALLVAATDLFAGFVADSYEAVKYAGVLAGVGVPATLIGVFTVLPAGRRVRAAAAISASLCMLGVALFWHAYPHHWRGYGDDLTLHVSAVYLLGLFTAIWCLFTAVVNFKTRNDPGGTLEMTVTREGETKVVEVERERSTGLGGIGFLGSTPDGEVETQTNDPDSSAFTYDERSSGAGTGLGSRSRAATSDGGTSTQDLSSPLDADAEIVDDRPSAAAASGPTDRYCGNCRHFEYVRSSSGIVPYCGRHDEVMDDMDACEEWTPNRR